MFTGTLIEDLMATVERAERFACPSKETEPHMSETWHGIASYEFARPANNLLGVA
jgi:hypothetical protein